MATTPLFMMPVAAVFYGARIGWRGLCGTLLAVLGAALLFWR
jgi:drug/metabolite transporter (DMT)-like permease